MGIKDCVLVDFTNIADARGCLSIVECHKHIPFTIQRIFYIHTLAPGAKRGGHAHFKGQEFIIPISGHFKVTLYDGFDEKEIHLSHFNRGLYLPPLIWIELSQFSPNAMCLVLASSHYDENDYIRNFETFLQTVGRLVNANTVP